MAFLRVVRPAVIRRAVVATPQRAAFSGSVRVWSGKEDRLRKSLFHRGSEARRRYFASFISSIAARLVPPALLRLHTIILTEDHRTNLLFITDHEGRKEEIQEHKSDSLNKAEKGKGQWKDELASNSESIVCNFPHSSPASTNTC